MKIGINLYDLKPAENGGMADYIKSLIYYLPKVSQSDTFYLIVRKESQQNFQKQSNVKEIKMNEIFCRESLSQKLKDIISEHKLNVWFSPLLVLDPPFCPIPAATTIPDMQHEYYPNFFHEDVLKWRKTNYQMSADNADMIFTLSDNSRNDIVRFLDVDLDKVKRIYIDSSINFNKKTNKEYLNKIKKRYRLPDKYLFYPANTWPHKNHLRLLEAFNRIKKNTDIELVFSGYSHQAMKEINEFVDDNNLRKRVRFLGYIREEDLQGVYKNAIGLIFPSLFEGFGIPLIEAFRSEVPVLCSCNAGIHEVAGDAAVYFDPLSISSMSKTILDFLNDADLRNRLKKLGVEQAKKFSYKKTAEATLHYLKQIASKGKSASKINASWPRISVITPSFNQGKYIERTIKSVLDQKYPNLEYIVVDGGSSDNTVNILKKYSDKLIWMSEKDDGQADAINKGIRMSSGQILSYLNSDDTYESGSLKKIASYFVNNPMAKFVYGKGRHIDKKDNFIEDYPSMPTDYTGLHPTCAICQPTAYWKRDLLKDVGYFDASLKYAMDYDYWIRISLKYPLNFIYEYLGNTRFYEETKTSGQKPKVHREIIEVQKRHYNKVHANWILAYVHAKLSTNNRSTIYKNTIFLISLILGSFLGFVKFGGSLPPRRVWKYYLVWTKEIFSFIYRKKFKKYFK